jgi:uncharacterized SAM-binding protein YcdF (DUF218 family)
VAWFRTRKNSFLLFFSLAAIVVFTHSLWLGALGAYLIHADPPTKADYAVVLAGDAHGHRVIEAAELVRRGFVRKVLVSGPCCCYDVPESDMAVSFAVRKGYPEEYFIKVPHSATSTWQEAQVLIPELRRLGAHSFLLVTSDFHTRRAGRYFGKLADGLAMHVIATPDEYFRWNSWWHDREAQKVFYMEWSKTIFSFFGM